MKKLSEIFHIYSGNKLDFNKMTTSKNGISFVSRTSKNNGVVAYVEEIGTVKPFNEGLITVSLGGSYVLSTFIQPRRFYTGQNVAVLEPIEPMTDIIKAYYCKCITMNRYKYSAFGREANKTLKDLLLPSYDEIPIEFTQLKIPDFSNIPNKSEENGLDTINSSEWREFTYKEIFDIKGGYYNKKPEKHTAGIIPFIGATRENNGITGLYSEEDISMYHKNGSTTTDSYNLKIFKKKCITVVNNGASVGNAFYQENIFTCSHDVNVLYLKNYELNKYVAMFLITIITLDKYRWNYGRKWRPNRMGESIIKLPTKFDKQKKEYTPDYEYMENFIKGRMYSSSI